MPLIETENYLDALINGEKSNVCNRKPLLSKIMRHQDLSFEEVEMFLLSQGMLPVMRDSPNILDKWKEERKNDRLEVVYKDLITTFDGPDIDIFLFPLDVNNQVLMTEMNGKNGISFPGLILLFIITGLSEKEKEALLTHEYHHCCWLAHHGKNEETVTLLDSLIMEGLAEWEVGKRVGEDYYAPWVSYYSDNILKAWWGRAFEKRLEIEGRQYQHPLIYGGRFGIPKWMGYSLGFRIVESFIENTSLSSLHAKDLLKLQSSVIYDGSIFRSEG